MQSVILSYFSSVRSVRVQKQKKNRAKFSRRHRMRAGSAIKIHTTTAVVVCTSTMGVD